MVRKILVKTGKFIYHFIFSFS